MISEGGPGPLPPPPSSESVHAFKIIITLKRTSNSVNEGLPIKMARLKFSKKMIFSVEKVVG